MSGWKWWYVVIAAVFVVTGLVGWNVVRNVPDAGLAGVSSVDELMNLPVTIEYAEGDQAPPEDQDNNGTIEAWETQPETPIEDYVNFYSDSRDSCLEELKSADMALVVKATGELEINASTLGQHFTVERVILGSSSAPAVGEDCAVWRDYGLQVMDGGITLRDTTNLMQPGQEYLLLLNDDELNAYSGYRYYHFAAYSFSLIRLPYTPETALPDGVRTKNYSEWAGYEYFSAAQEISDIRNEIKKEILTQYGLYEG